MRGKILLLEDDITLQEIIAECLIEEDYSVQCFDNGLEAVNAAYEQEFDLLLLDVMVAGENGFEALREIRKSGKDTPAIFITALNSLKDVEIGFKSGCDDYLRKPFELSELLLRIEVLLKRVQKHCIFDFGNGYSFDSATTMLYFQNKPHKIATKESELLKILLKHQGQFVPLEQIYTHLWGYDAIPSDAALRVYVKNLRQIVGKERILTRRGGGYCLQEIHNGH